MRAMPERPMSVSTQPGHTAFTVIFRGASSSARVREPDDRVLRRAVGGHAGNPEASRHRGEVHDAAAVGQERPCRAADTPRAREVHVQILCHASSDRSSPSKGSARQFPRCSRGCRGAGPGARPARRPSRRRRRPRRRGGRSSPSLRRADLGHDGRAVGFLARPDRDVGAFRREPKRDGPPMPRPAPVTSAFFPVRSSSPMTLRRAILRAPTESFETVGPMLGERYDR